MSELQKERSAWLRPPCSASEGRSERCLVLQPRLTSCCLVFLCAEETARFTTFTLVFRQTSRSKTKAPFLESRDSARRSSSPRPHYLNHTNEPSDVWPSVVGDVCRGTEDRYPPCSSRNPPGLQAAQRGWRRRQRRGLFFNVNGCEEPHCSDAINWPSMGGPSPVAGLRGNLEEPSLAAASALSRAPSLSLSLESGGFECKMAEGSG